MQHKSIAGCVLAGGRGSRAEGKDKCLFQYEGKTFLERAMEVFGDWEECLLSYNRNQEQVKIILGKIEKERHEQGKASIRIIPDQDNVKNIGPMGGLYSVLKSCKSDAVLVTPCDVPFFQMKMVEILVEAYQSGMDAVIMTSQNKLQPLCGIYTKKVLPVMEQCIEAKEYKPRCVLEQVNTHYIKAEAHGIPEECFANINTMEELKKLQNKSQIIV